MRTLLATLFLAVGALAQAPSATTAAPAAIVQKTAGMAAFGGFVPIYWDARQGKLWLEVTRWNTEFLYVNSLPAGVGSNDLGLDRGQTGDTRVVRFERSGPRVLLVESNYAFRAISPDANERRAVKESFAESVLGGFDVAAEEEGRVLIDATDFFLRDAHQVTERLRNLKQGNFRLDGRRSAFYLDRTKNFPRNTEVEVTLTFAGESPGNFVREVVPTPDSLTVREHHSLVQLPEDGYQPRRFDPRAGYFGIEYMDFATPIAEPIRKRWIARHRLQKRDPAAALSDPVQPIRYYLDRGAPEPIRSALLEGARWWNQAFEAAGFRQAFQVELMPEGADPMDIRYNVIQWVHRSTRGWSYGSSIVDPRTGEIIKGIVTLGSLRVRQDFLIAEGLLSPYRDGDGVPPDMERMALSRLRQLAAHEVGHTLGLAHNYAASMAQRSSVMDYPHPLVQLTSDGSIDLSQAYATGIGEWDKVAITYGYQHYRPGLKEESALPDLLKQAYGRGLFFLTDQDARPAGSASPVAHLWDNGSNPVDELTRMMAVRAKALSRFGEASVRRGVPLSLLADVLVPLYLSHRYQTEAAAKVVGGVDYRFAVRGDGQHPTVPIPAVEQRRALTALLTTISPDALTLPESLITLIAPRAYGYPRTRESFPARTGLTFDPISAAESGAVLTASLLLHQERAARLVEAHARDSHALGLEEVIDLLLAQTWRKPAAPGLPAEIGRRVGWVVLTQLMALANEDAASPQVRAVSQAKLEQLRQWLLFNQSSDESQNAHLSYAAHQIQRFQQDPKQLALPKPVEPPPGQPIGCEE